MKKNQFNILKWITMFIILLWVAIPFSHAQTVADLYSKEMVTMYCVSRPGGGGDFAARILASYWSDATGGAMVVKNMPGAGGLKGINYLNNAKPDGLSLGLVDFGGQMLGPWLFKNPGAKYDINKFNWITVFAGDPYTFVVRAGSPYTSLADLKGAEGFKFGTVTRSGTDAVAAALLIEALQLKNAKIIPGYRGTSPIGLAMGRGEVDGAVFNHGATIAFINKKFAKEPFLAIWPERIKELPNVPTLTEAVQLSPKTQKLFNIFKALESAKVVFTPPGVPDEKVQFIRESVAKVLAMNGFRRQLNARFLIWVDPTAGADVGAKVQKLQEIPKADIADTEAILKKYVK